MTIKFLRVGSANQAFGYDDGTFATAISTSDPIEVNALPTASAHVLRLSDIGGITISAIPVANIDNPSTELNALTGDTSSLALVYQAGAGVNSSTLYTWDSAITGSENVPYIVDGATGYWIAIGGKYVASTLSVLGNTVLKSAFQHDGSTIGVFGVVATTKTIVTDPASVVTTETSGASYTGNEQTMLANLKADVIAIQGKLTSLINALQSYGLV